MRAIGLSGHVIFPPKPIELTETTIEEIMKKAKITIKGIPPTWIHLGDFGNTSLTLTDN